MVSPQGAITLTGSMQEERAVHTSTFLPNGKVLVTGGFDSQEDFKNSAELFDPVINKFSYTGNMHGKRAGHSAVLLNNGMVLIVGGTVGNVDQYSKVAELYDPETGEFTLSGTMQVPRMSCSATLLSDGRVLVAGGLIGNDPTTSVEIYDPETGTFKPGGNMKTINGTNNALLLKSGKVLLIGSNLAGELYDPKTETSVPLPTVSNQPVKHKYAATLLSNNRLLITGGSDNRDWNGKFATAVIYDLEKNKWTPAENMHVPRFKHMNATVLLENGNVLVAGGAEFAELYDATTGHFIEIPGSFHKILQYTTATRLHDNRVLITGGYETNIICTKEAWVYQSPVVN